jgi:MFS family permease
MRAAFTPLKLSGFRRLAAGYTVNELGNWLGDIALAVVVYDRTGSPLATAGLFVGTHFLPALFGPALVARVEVLGSRVALPLLYAAEAAAFVALAWLVDDFVLVAVIAVAAVDGVLAAAGRALTRAAAAAVLKPAGQLREGNAVINFGFTAAAAIGPATGGLLVAGVGPQTALLLDAASFLLVAAMLALPGSVPNVKAEPASWFARLRDGLDYVARRPALRRLLGAQAAAFVFFAAVLPIEVVLVKETLGGGDAGYGALLASWGAGMVAGGLVFALARRLPLKVLLLASTIAVGAGYLGMGVAPTLLAACAAAALGGLGNGVQWVSLVSAVQEATADRYQARVLVVLEGPAAAMPGVGFLLGGAVAALLSPRASFLVAGAGVLAVVAVAAPLLRRASWGEPAPAAEPEQPAALAA